MMKKKTAFLFDRMLVSLCRKMRLLGFDSELVDEEDSGRFLLIADREGRTAVTRARRYSDRPGNPPLILTSEGTNNQLVELLRQTEDIADFEPFTRCLECNELLEEESPETAAVEVPEFIGKTFQAYHRCPSCRRLYWEGTHFEAMKAQIEDIERRLKRE
jgi:uncharacterized protein with PIN domain